MKQKKDDLFPFPWPVMAIGFYGIYIASVPTLIWTAGQLLEPHKYTQFNICVEEVLGRLSFLETSTPKALVKFAYHHTAIPIRSATCLWRAARSDVALGN